MSRCPPLPPDVLATSFGVSRFAAGVVFEPRPLRHDGQQTLACAARPVEAGLPLGHRLLADAELIGQAFLRQRQMPSQLPDRGRVPARPPALSSHSHIIHGTVYSSAISKCTGAL